MIQNLTSRCWVLKVLCDITILLLLSNTTCLVVILCALLTLCASHVAALDFSNSKWIWTSPAGATAVPALATADFRKDFAAPDGKIPVSASIIISADNVYTLYVNGEKIGTGNNFQQSQSYCVDLEPGCNNVFAVSVLNEPGAGGVATPASLITAIDVTYIDGTSTTIVSDPSWRAHDNETPGFESVNFDDSAWPNAVVVGNADSPPWGVPSIPSVLCG